MVGSSPLIVESPPVVLRGRGPHESVSLRGAVCDRNQDLPAGAQTERRGMPGPVQGIAWRRYVTSRSPSANVSARSCWIRSLTARALASAQNERDAEGVWRRHPLDALICPRSLNSLDTHRQAKRTRKPWEYRRSSQTP